MPRNEATSEVPAIFFLLPGSPGLVSLSLILDQRGLRRAPLGPEEERLLLAHLRLFEAAQLIEDQLAAQYMQQAAQDRLREQAMRLLKAEP